ncbi:MAG: hypothetical protein WCW68_08930 [Methanothrix sp.]
MKKKNFRMDLDAHRILKETVEDLSERGIDGATMSDAVRELYRRQAK